MFFLETSFIIVFIVLSLGAILLTRKFANLKAHRRFRPALTNVIGLFIFLTVLNFFISWGLVSLMGSGATNIMDSKKEMKSRK